MYGMEWYPVGGKGIKKRRAEKSSYTIQSRIVEQFDNFILLTLITSFDIIRV